MQRLTLSHENNLKVPFRAGAPCAAGIQLQAPFAVGEPNADVPRAQRPSGIEPIDSSGAGHCSTKWPWCPRPRQGGASNMIAPRLEPKVPLIRILRLAGGSGAAGIQRQAPAAAGVPRAEAGKVHRRTKLYLVQEVSSW